MNVSKCPSHDYTPPTCTTPPPGPGSGLPSTRPPSDGPAKTPGLFGRGDGVDFTAARTAGGQSGGAIVCEDGEHVHATFPTDKPSVTLTCCDDDHKK